MAARWALQAALGASLAAACAAASAAARIVDIAWAAGGTFVHKTHLDGANLLEVCGELAAGDKVQWRYTAGAPLAFNIHHHVGKAVHYSARRASAAKAQGRLQPRSRQTYCWMWQTKSSEPVAIELTLQRTAAR